MVWNIIKGMLDPNTMKKIRMIGSDKSEIFDVINKNQIEKRFGGTAENVEKYFFPHVMPDDKILDVKEDKKGFLVTEDEYCEYVEKNTEYGKSPYIEWEKKKIIFEQITEQLESTDMKSPTLNSKESMSTGTGSKGNGEDYVASYETKSSTEIKDSLKKMNNHRKKPSIDMLK